MRNVVFPHYFILVRDYFLLLRRVDFLRRVIERRDERRRLLAPPILNWLSVLNKGAVGSTPPGHVVYALCCDKGAGAGGERIRLFIIITRCTKKIETHNSNYKLLSPAFHSSIPYARLRL